MPSRTPVQFGLLGGAGGDLVVGEGKDTQTIQSKYVTAGAEATICANIAKAVYQLSGETGEQPMLEGKRVADVVIEGEAGIKAAAGPAIAEKLVRTALDGDTYPQVDLWKHVDRITLRSIKDIVHLDVLPGKKLSVFATIAYRTREGDFPGLHVVGQSTFKQLLQDHVNQLGPASAPVPAPQPVAAVQPPVRAQSATITADPEAGPLIGKASTVEGIAAVIAHLRDSASVVNKDDALAVLERALAGGYAGAGDAINLIDGMLATLRDGYGKPIDLENRFKTLLRRWRTFEKQQESKEEEAEETEPIEPRNAPAIDDPRLKELGGEPELIRAMTPRTGDPSWKPDVVLSAFRCLIDPGKLAPAVAADAVGDMFKTRLGREAIDVIASKVLWTEAKARNYPIVLGALKQVDERVTAPGVILHARDMWRDEKGAAQGWRLAFEYDEKTPGMWQVTEKHFDMDVGWVLEASPLRVKSLRQVKVAESLAGINNNMKASLEKGQLSLTAAGDRRIVIYAPAVASAEYFQGEWRQELRRRLWGIADVVGVRMQVQFSDGMFEIPLSDVAQELADEAEQRAAEEAASWTVVTRGKKGNKKGAHA